MQTKVLGSSGDTTKLPSVVSLPVSWGEVFDRYTIGCIRHTKKASDTTKANAQDAELLKLFNSVPTSVLLEHLKDGLQVVNNGLWDIEDKLRLLEEQGSFGSEFIELARMVYKLNDLRAAYKNMINHELGSDLNDNKIYKRDQP